jgi:hypothetical protein
MPMPSGLNNMILPPVCGVDADMNPKILTRSKSTARKKTGECGSQGNKHPRLFIVDFRVNVVYS